MDNYYNVTLVGKNSGRSTYPFPNEKAATRFAESHIQMPGTDEVFIADPEGKTIRHIRGSKTKKTVEWVATGNTGHGKTPYTAVYK
jgi:hypothetical protein